MLYYWRISDSPEVLLAATCNNTLSRQVTQPEVPGLQIGLQTHLLVTSEVGGVKATLVQTEIHSQTLPGPGDCLLLEVVTKTPVTQHLKEGVMIHILSYVLKIVVFTTGTNALLTVDSSL